MAAGDDQGDAALGERAVVEDVDGGVAGEVVHAVEGDTEGQRVGLAGGKADLHRRGEAGPGGGGDGVDVAEADPGLVEGVAHHRGDGVQVGAGGDLRDDASEAGVLVHARGEGVAEQDAVGDDADAGFVAGGLDAQDDRHRSVLSGADAHPGVLCGGGQESLAGAGGQAVDVGEAVEVVDLVLQAAGERAGAVDADGLAVQVDADDGGGGLAGHLGVLAGHGQAALGVGDEVTLLR